jgi:hypothetical protein
MKLLIASAVGLGAASALAQTAPGDPAGNQTIPEKVQSWPLEPRNGGVSDPVRPKRRDIVSAISWTCPYGQSLPLGICPSRCASGSGRGWDGRARYGPALSTRGMAGRGVSGSGS